MINFNAPPKKRVAAALKGFGFGTVRSTAQHLRGLGLVRPMVKLTVAGEAKVNTPISIVPTSSGGMTLMTEKGGGGSPNVTQPTVESGQTAKHPAQGTGDPAGREKDVFAEGRTETDWSPGSDVEDSGGGSEYPQGNEDSGGGGGGGSEYAQGTPGDGSSATDTNQRLVVATGSAVRAGTGLMAQISALPMPVKLIGGAVVAYAVLKLAKVIK
ncbi:MAG: hypothetical protein WC700_18240 [Gemmatimonadaceae bacterium]|jgi:hypothetical protein